MWLQDLGSRALWAQIVGFKVEGASFFDAAQPISSRCPESPNPSGIALYTIHHPSITAL